MQAVIGERPGHATGKTVNLREEDSIVRFFEEVGRFDHLVITAGDWTGPMFVPLKDLTAACWSGDS